MEKIKQENKSEVKSEEKKALKTSTVVASKYIKKKSGSVYFGKISPLKMAFAFRHMGIMLKSGLSLEAAIKVLSEQLDDARLREIFAEILFGINEGVSIAETMRNHRNIFSNLVISLISSGEQGGTLEKNLFILADYLKKAHELQQKVKGAMIYPLIVLGMTSVEVLGVVYFLLPRLDSMFSTFGELPAFTKVILDAAKFIRDNTVSLLLILIVFIITLSLFLNKTKIGKRIKNWFALNFPVFKNLNKNTILSNFSQTFALLLENGIPITKALEIAAETSDNVYYQESLAKINESVQGGLSMAQSMEKFPKYFPPTYSKMVEIGEQTGSLSETLLYVHEFYAEEAAEVSNNLATLLEPILLIFIGVMIGGLAMIIIGPIYQLMGTING